jgi:prepilin-type N-terminal cleavage/methylation domain-containing protein
MQKRRKTRHYNQTGKGFTLIEVLLVISLISILFAIVIIAVNPGRQFQQANNSQRRSDINAILNAVSQFQNDNRGQLPTGITGTTTKIIGTAVSGCDTLTCAGTTTPATCLDLTSALTPTYLAAIPFDPLQSDSSNTRYAIVATSTSRVVVTACNAELGETITITR